MYGRPPRRLQRCVLSHILMLLGLTVSQAFQSTLIRQLPSHTPRKAHIFDPFQGKSRYIIPENNDDGSAAAPPGYRKNEETNNNGFAATGVSNGISTSNGMMSRNGDGANNAANSGIGQGAYGNSPTAYIPTQSGAEAKKNGVSNSHSTALSSKPFSMADLRLQMGALQQIIEARNKTAQGTADKISRTSLDAVARIQTTSQNLHKIVTDLKQQTESARSDLRVRELELERFKKESKEQEKLANEKINRMAEQLQNIKLQSHTSQMAIRDAGISEQSRLRERINDLEQTLESQQNVSESEGVKAKDQYQRQADVEHELELAKQALQASVKELEDRLSHEKAARIDEVKALEAKRQLEVDRVRQELEQAVQAASATVESLRNLLQQKESDYQHQVRQLEQQHAAKEATTTEKIQHIANELIRVKLEAHQQSMKEKEEAERIRHQLGDQIEARERELALESERVAELDRKVAENVGKRQQLKSELESLHKKYNDTVSEWESRYSELEAIRLRERESSESRLTRRAMEGAQAVEQEVEHAANFQKLKMEIQQLEQRSRRELEEEQRSSASARRELQQKIDAKEKELMRQNEENEQMKTREQIHLQRIDDLGFELLTLKNNYTRESALWEGRHQSLTEARTNERQEADAKIALIENEAKKKLAETVVAAKSTQSSLEQKARVTETLLFELKTQHEKNVTVYQSKIHDIERELNHTRTETERILAAERLAVAEEKRLLRLQLQEKESAFANEAKLRDDLERETTMQKASHAQKEKELMTLRSKYDAEVSLWNDRYELLKQAMTEQQQLSRKHIAEKEAESRNLVELHRNETDRLQKLFSSDLEARDEQHGRLIQQQQDIFGRREAELLKQISSMNHLVEQLKEAEEKQLSMEKADALARQTELLSKIEQKENELEEQSRMRQKAEIALQEATARHGTFQDELVDLTKRLASSEKEWESKYKSLEESRLAQQAEAEANIARAETVAQSKVDSALELLRAKEAEFARCLKQMDDETRQKAGDIHEQYLSREKDLMMRIETEKAKLLELTATSKESLLSERQAAESRLDELRAAIADKDEKIATYLSVNEDLKSKEAKQQLILQRLENDLAVVTTEHAKEVSDLMQRCKSLESVLKEKDGAIQVAQKQYLEAKQKIDEAMRTAEKFRVDIEASAKARGSVLERTIEQLRDTVRADQAELARSNEQLRSLQADAKHKEAQLQQQLGEMEQKIASQTANSEKLEIEHKSQLKARETLETELASLQARHKVGITELQGKVDSLEKSLDATRKSHAETMELKEKDFREKLEAMSTAMRVEQASFDTSMKHKEKLLNIDMARLKDASAFRESELTKRLRVVTDEFQQYKFSSHKALMEARQEAQHANEELAKRVEKEKEPSREERIRFDLSKLLLKKEVEVMKKAEELSSIRATREAFFTKKQTGNDQPRARGRLASIKERVSRIFLRSPDDIKIPQKSKANELVKR